MINVQRLSQRNGERTGRSGWPHELLLAEVAIFSPQPPDTHPGAGPNTSELLPPKLRDCHLNRCPCHKEHLLELDVSARRAATKDSRKQYGHRPELGHRSTEGVFKSCRAEANHSEHEEKKQNATGDRNTNIMRTGKLLNDGAI